MARPTKKGYAMTGAERTRDYRAKRKRDTVDAVMVQQWLRDAIGKHRLQVPEIEYCGRLARFISAGMAAFSSSPSEPGTGWHFHAHALAHAWDTGCRGTLRSLKEDAPLCTFVQIVLKHFGCRKSTSAISAALRARRGCQPRWHSVWPRPKVDKIRHPESED